MLSRSTRGRRLIDTLVLWAVFFAIAAGLGYPTLNRYDPRIQGPDQTGFYEMVTTGRMSPSHAVGHRVMIPLLAAPLYELTRGHLGTWNPVWFAMLVVNSFFVAATAVAMLVLLGRLGITMEVALVAVLIYLVNFAIPNYQLAAYVDSGEAFFLVLLTWALLESRWALLPVIALMGTIAKETFFPISTAFVAGWLFAVPAARPKRGAIAALVVVALVGLVTTTALLSLKDGELSWPWGFAAQLEGSERSSSIVRGFWGLFSNRDMWYVFMWLLALAIPSLSRAHRPWLIAAACASAVVVILCSYDDSGPNANRPLFNITGPLLATAASQTMFRLVRGAVRPGTEG